MTAEFAVELVQRAFWMTLLVSGPVLLLGLIVGLLIAFFQAVTSLQEQTLVFVPKIVAMGAAAAFVLPWAVRALVEYARGLFASLPY